MININTSNLNNMTSQSYDAQENVGNSQNNINYSNNQPLFILIGCLFILFSCFVFNWYVNVYLPEKNKSNEVLLDKKFDFENKNRLKSKKSILPNLV